MQFINAGMISGSPSGLNVVEFDAVDEKNMYYLPKNTAYTALASKDRAKRILDCVKKVNAG